MKLKGQLDILWISYRGVGTVPSFRLELETNRKYLESIFPAMHIYISKFLLI